MINDHHLVCQMRFGNQLAQPVMEVNAADGSTCERINKLETSESEPKIHAKFLHQPNCEAEHILRISIEKVKEKCLLVIGLSPELDVISSGPIAAETEYEIIGVPVVTIVESSGGTWDICYPQSVFDRRTYLPPDQRDIAGWNLQVCIAHSILVKTMKFARDVGKTQIIGPSELSQGLWVLVGPQDSKTYSNFSWFHTKEIVGGEAGVLFYVDYSALIVFEEKKFDADFVEHPVVVPEN